MRPPPLALASLVKPTGLNKTEGRYHDQLVLQQARGEVLWFAAHAITLVLGHDCRYTPDFLVVPADGVLTCIEVKGDYIRSGDDGMVKLRSAAEAFPFRFQRAQLKAQGGWELITIPRR